MCRNIKTLSWTLEKQKVIGRLVLVHDGALKTNSELFSSGLFQGTADYQETRPHTDRECFSNIFKDTLCHFSWLVMFFAVGSSLPTPRVQPNISTAPPVSRPVIQSTLDLPGTKTVSDTVLQNKDRLFTPSVESAEVEAFLRKHFGPYSWHTFVYPFRRRSWTFPVCPLCQPLISAHLLMRIVPLSLFVCTAAC